VQCQCHVCVVYNASIATKTPNVTVNTTSMLTLPTPLSWVPALALADAPEPEPELEPEPKPDPAELAAPLPAEGATPPVGAIIVPLCMPPAVPVAVVNPLMPVTAVAATDPVLVHEQAESK